ncbi:methyltransferase domain-containing protein [Nitrospirillum iridis]|uniref:SAM-dependent methyltransferase n=1 Tax=Nitrospirillum iridis TaxID=765888 RepID=A0A7X0B3Y4_9PROT|nr:class I SAM-dependent methyltransferase [Nitrospirillum iridis]MBB6254531.1 SAM-dependent methyltransferase [Nitrospirillum iridis]
MNSPVTELKRPGVAATGEHRGSLPPLDPATMFNGFIGANVAFALVESGVFTALAPDAHATIPELARSAACLEYRLRPLLQAGRHLGLVTIDDEETVSWTDSGRELHRNKGYFTWCVGGYGRFLRELGALTREPSPATKLRDGSYVALGADQNNAALMQQTLNAVMDTLEFRRVADLGCGNAGRLIDFCRRYDGITGVGIDINPLAMSAAEENIRQSRMTSRISLHCQDVLKSIQDPKILESLRDVDVVTCFMMLHDLMNVDDLKDHLFDRLRVAFPSAKYFVIADTATMEFDQGLIERPIFNIGYELLHAFMDTKLFTKQFYIEKFITAGLELQSCDDFGTPNTYLFVLKS